MITGLRGALSLAYADERGSVDTALILADPSDPDYALVEEMVGPEELTPGWQALIAFVFEFVLFGSALALVRRSLEEREAIDP